MDGYLLIDKPAGWTSFDVVNKLRFMLADYLDRPPKSLKVGHSGTLDPMATGLLVVLVGGYTKRQDEFMKLDKTYWAYVTLGASSDTDDADGKVVKTPNVALPSQAQIRAALKHQTGQLKQLPPQFSALKRRGKKAYELAREGKTTELKPRSVTVYAITDVDYEWPVLRFRARVSSGTYIRSLARDIGQELGVGGYLSQLRREQIGGYSLQSANQMEALNANNLAQHLLQA